MSLKQKNMRRGAEDVVSGGFTIIETLVGITILLISIATPLTIAEKGLASAEAARLEITAFYLAQEAIEYVRNVRDTNAISGRGGGPNWLQGLNNCFAPEGCGIDTAANQGLQIVPCNASNEDCVLYQFTGVTGNAFDNDCMPEVTTSEDTQKGLFGHRSTNGWEKTCFTRKVYVQETVDDVEAATTVRVMWTAGSLGPRAIDVNEHLLNWYESP